MSEDSKRGKIYSIKCRDFVTYESIEVHPGENLNVIIGPNGAGKSTIVAAIVLGMGGDPKLLSRAGTVAFYVKNGKEEAWIEIKIYSSSDRIITFERKFNLANKNDWLINGKRVTFKEYERNIAEFNIQIGNLCQFLPQDRVQDFAKQNPQEILENTQKSVCLPNMGEMFNRLKELRHNQLNGKKKTNENMAKLKEAETRSAELKAVIDQMNEKKLYQKNIIIAEAKKLWLEALEMKEKLGVVKKEQGEANTIVQRNQEKYNEIEAKTSEIIKMTQKLTNLAQKDDEKIREFSDKIEKMSEKHDELASSINVARQEYENKKVEEAERLGEEENAKGVLQGYLQDFQNAIQSKGPEKNFKEKIREFDSKIDRLKSETNQLISRRRQINQTLDEDFKSEIEHYKRKIEMMENVGQQKLNWLRERHGDVYRAVIWLRSNKHHFQGRIYEPMILELNVKDQRNAKYFENTVAIRDLLAFTCEDKSDMSMLTSKLCVEQRLKVNVLHSNSSVGCKFAPPESIQNYVNFGFYSFMIDMIEGPAPLLNYLCQIYKLHTILVGTEEANKYTDNLPDKYRLYFAGDQRYQVSFSKYTKERSLMRAAIAPRNILSMNVDTKELNKLKRNLHQKTSQTDILKNERTEIEARVTELETQRNEIQTQKRAHESKAMVIAQLKQQVDIQNKKIERIKSAAIDLEVEKEKFKSFASSIVRQIMENQTQKIGLLEEYQKLWEQSEFKKAKLQVFKMQNSDIEREVQETKDQLHNAKKLFETISGVYQRQLKEYKTKITMAKEASEGKDITDPDFPYTRKFTKLPNDLNSLKEHIDEQQARVDCMTTDSQSVIEEYEQQEAQIRNLKETIEAANANDQQQEEEMTQLHNTWYPKMRQTVEEINTYFGDFMKSMDYVGECQLVSKEERDYESYGIQISVQYRNNARLQALDRYVQSGGERAVAIAVYTLSLQHITNVPFRCVDEINQGMDPRNERKVFEMLVEETTRAGRSQYFFVTPKLLPNLKHNEKTTVLLIFNAKLGDGDVGFF